MKLYPLIFTILALLMLGCEESFDDVKGDLNTAVPSLEYSITNDSSQNVVAVYTHEIKDSDDHLAGKQQAKAIPSGTTRTLTIQYTVFSDASLTLLLGNTSKYVSIDETAANSSITITDEDFGDLL